MPARRSSPGKLLGEPRKSSAPAQRKAQHGAERPRGAAVCERSGMPGAGCHAASGEWRRLAGRRGVAGCDAAPWAVRAGLDGDARGGAGKRCECRRGGLREASATAWAVQLLSSQIEGNAKKQCACEGFVKCIGATRVLLAPSTLPHHTKGNQTWQLAKIRRICTSVCGAHPPISPKPRDCCSLMTEACGKVSVTGRKNRPVATGMVRQAANTSFICPPLPPLRAGVPFCDTALGVSRTWMREAVRSLSRLSSETDE